jgi:hypothetical protein
VIQNVFLFTVGNVLVTQFLQTFEELPPRQEAASFTVDHAVKKPHQWLAGRS